MAKTKISRRDFIAAAGMGAAALSLNCARISKKAERKGPKSDYPVVVIGSGLGGLTSAAYFSRSGFPVTVVEQHDIPGGYATAFDRAAGKFRFEVSLHGSALKSRSTQTILKELEIDDRLELVRLPDIYRIKSASGDVVIPQCDPQGFIEQLSQRYPDEAEGIAGFVNHIVGIHEEVEKYDRKSAAVKKWTKIFFPMLYPKMWKVRSQTLANMMNEYVKNDEVRHLLSFLWTYYGLPPEQLSGFYYANATGGYLKKGSYYIKDRSQKLSDLLVEVIESGGGQLMLETKAEKVLLKNGAVSGVALADGSVLPAKAVVSNTSAVTLFNRMLPRGSVPSDYLKKLNSYKPSISTFIVWLGLNRPLRGKVPGFSTSIHDSHHSPSKSYQLAMQGNIDKTGYNVCLYDNLWDGYSTPGTSSLMIVSLCGYDPWRRFEADYRAGKKQAYGAEKARWAEILIKRTEKDLIPGLTSMIEIQEAATPLTNWRYTGNTDGAIYGFEQSMENSFMKRIGNHTPIKGLHMAGGWGNPGGGFVAVMLSGRRTFHEVVTSWNV